MPVDRPFMRAFVYVLLCCCGMFNAVNAAAQTSATDSTSYSKTAQAVIDYFHKQTGDQAAYLNGPEYSIFRPANKGTFYFLDKAEVTPGDIGYKDAFYTNVPLLYDVHLDQMVSVVNGHLFVLNPQNIVDVDLLGHHFVNLHEANPYKLASGYYDELYNGGVKVWVKRTKVIEEHLVPPQTPETYYVDKAAIYIKKGSNIFPIESKSQLLKALDNANKTLKKYFDDNKVDYKADPEAAVIKAAKFIDANK